MLPGTFAVRVLPPQRYVESAADGIPGTVGGTVVGVGAVEPGGANRAGRRGRGDRLPAPARAEPALTTRPCWRRTATRPGRKSHPAPAAFAAGSACVTSEEQNRQLAEVVPAAPPAPPPSVTVYEVTAPAMNPSGSTTVIVYVPAARPVNEKSPFASVVAVRVTTSTWESVYWAWTVTPASPGSTVGSACVPRGSRVPLPFMSAKTLPDRPNVCGAGGPCGQCRTPHASAPPLAPNWWAGAGESFPFRAVRRERSETLRKRGHRDRGCLRPLPSETCGSCPLADRVSTGIQENASRGT